MDSSIFIYFLPAMDLIEKVTIQGFHRSRLGEDRIHALGYREVESQLQRFLAILGWGDLNGCSVLDLGCGYGDLRPFLAQHYQDTIYLGVDFLKEFVSEAQQRYGHLPNTQFFQADFLNVGLPEVDCVIASGSLNYRSKNELHPWQTIAKMWDIAQRGVIINLLDARRFEAGTLLCGYDPEQVLNFCRQLDPHARIRDDYLPDDFTIYMHK